MTGGTGRPRPSWRVGWLESVSAAARLRAAAAVAIRRVLWMSFMGVCLFVVLFFWAVGPPLFRDQ